MAVKPIGWTPNSLPSICFPGERCHYQKYDPETIEKNEVYYKKISSSGEHTLSTVILNLEQTYIHSQSKATFFLLLF